MSDKEEILIWASKQELINKYFLGLKLKTLNNILTEMRKTKDFGKYIKNPTQKIVFINVVGFGRFLAYKEEKRWK